jgi:hypothetical protein
MSDVSGSFHVPARPGIVSWLFGGGVDTVGMSELHEQAITSIASTKDKKVINTFLFGFMTFSFLKKVMDSWCYCTIFAENIYSQFFSHFSYCLYLLKTSCLISFIETLRLLHKKYWGARYAPQVSCIENRVGDG